MLPLMRLMRQLEFCRGGSGRPAGPYQLHPNLITGSGRSDKEPLGPLRSGCGSPDNRTHLVLFQNEPADGTKQNRFCCCSFCRARWRRSDRHPLGCPEPLLAPLPSIVMDRFHDNPNEGGRRLPGLQDRLTSDLRTDLEVQTRTRQLAILSMVSCWTCWTGTTGARTTSGLQ